MTQNALNFAETRADQIEAAWRKFHADNPKVWIMFQQFTFELLNAGRRHGSADMVCHRIRWETALKTVSKDPVKINNNFVAYYSRMFAHAYPEHALFFSQRRRISEDKPPYDEDIQVHDGGPKGSEAGLDVRITEMAHANTKEFHRP